MASVRFWNGEWERIWGCLKGHPGIYVLQEAPTRQFLELILWMARAVAPWRLLPAEFGPWNSAYKRFAEAHGRGHLEVPSRLSPGPGSHA